eukprot:scaffold21348_cov35-Phaeocystis_antarctica.AAC.1
MMRSSERKPGPSSPTRLMYHGMMATCSAHACMCMHGGHLRRERALKICVVGGRSGAGGLVREVWARAAMLGRRRMRRRRSGPEVWAGARAGWGRLGQAGAGWGRLGQAGAGWGRLGQAGAWWLSELGRSEVDQANGGGAAEQAQRELGREYNDAPGLDGEPRLRRLVHRAAQQHIVHVPGAKTRPVWPASTDHEADWPRMAEAGGSLRDGLARKAASGEPAGRKPRRLAFDLAMCTRTSVRSQSKS